MASCQSSRDSLRSRDRQLPPSGSLRPRHRSESRRLSDEHSDRRCPVRAVPREGDHCPGSLHEGDLVRVFSRTAGMWVDGEVVKFVGDSCVRVEYEVRQYWYGKTLHLHSDYLDVPSKLSKSGCRPEDEQEEELDPALEALAGLGSEKAKMELWLMARAGSRKAEKVANRLHMACHESSLPPTPAPEFLANASVTDATKTIQYSEPVKWAMRLSDFVKFIDACMATPLYNEIKRSKRSFERYVSIYDINEYFVVPWTRSKGCGVALLMNPEGLAAALMLSHAWGEDVEELLEAVRNHCEAENICGDEAIWFCTFAQYQPGDDAGPSVQDQVELDPFTKVINSVKDRHGMVAVHTSRADLYDRPWCVREVDEALRLSIEKNIIEVAMSKKIKVCMKDKYVMFMDAAREANVEDREEDALEAAGLQVHTARADCSKPKDKQRLLQELLRRPGGFKEIDQKVIKFRKEKVLGFAIKCLSTAQWRLVKQRINEQEMPKFNEVRNFF